MLRTSRFSRAQVAIYHGPLPRARPACSARITPLDWPRVAATMCVCCSAAGTLLLRAERVILVRAGHPTWLCGAAVLVSALTGWPAAGAGRGAARRRDGPGTAVRGVPGLPSAHPGYGRTRCADLACYVLQDWRVLSRDVSGPVRGRVRLGPKGGGKAMSDVTRLRKDHPLWHIHTTWACAGSGPDRCGLRSSRAGVTVRAWTAQALARRITEEDRRLATRNEPGELHPHVL